MKILAVITSAFCLLPSAFGGWLHTHGHDMVDDRGRVVRLAGVNSSGMEWGAGEPWGGGRCHEKQFGCYSEFNGPDDEEWQRIASWGFNSVRLPISWANLEPQPGRWNQEYLAALDRIVARCAQHHLDVVLSMHQWAWSPALHPEGKNERKIDHGNGMPAWLYPRGYDQIRARREFFENRGGVQEKFLAAWKLVAKRYASQPAVVGADLLNEPYLAMEGEHADGRVPLDDFFARAGAAVHDANPHLLLIVEEGGQTPIEHRLNLPNLVYSVHLYPKRWHDGGDRKLQRAVSRAAEWNVPLWVGEFDAFGGKTPEGWQPNTAAMLDAMKRAGVGWAYWAYARASRPLVNGEKVDQAVVDVLRRGF